ncbi:MAG: transketolase family protein [Actinomycetia bacterium]|nr:transketolase family protein [Actinomycetes bacterium]MCP5031208.1 transketolase family protein [Actinomycetes bacterium]
MNAYAKAPPHLEAIARLGRIRPEIVVVSQDFGGAGEFSQEFPERHFDVGISEQNLVGVAAGLAHAGKIAYVLAMAPFVSMRSFEQIRDDCAYNTNNVKIVALFTGLEAGPWGVTHHATEDLALMRCIPGMTVLVPADWTQLAAAIEAAAEIDGPVYIRAAGFAGDMSPLEGVEHEFRVGRAATLADGDDLAIIATGTMVRTALAVSAALASDGIGARVINMHTIKPIDRTVIELAANETGRLLTIEEHSIIGGLGSAVAETIADLGVGRLVRLGVPDRFCTEIAPYRELLQNCGLDVASVEATARELIRS